MGKCENNQEFCSALDGAMWSIWLHGNWKQITRSMTTEQKEAAAAAVVRYDKAHHGGDVEKITDFYWWRE